MNDIVYHGSPVKDLDVIKSNISSHNIECIYASENIVVAMMFMGKTNDLQTLKAMEGETPVLVERKEGILQKAYNKSSYIYLLPGKTFSHQNFLWKPEVISTEKSIKPITMIKCDNILESLKLQAENGKLKLYLYPDKPHYIPDDNSDLIDIYIRYEKNGIKGAIKQLIDEYPEFENIVNNKMNNEKEKGILNLTYKQKIHRW